MDIPTDMYITLRMKFRTSMMAQTLKNALMAYHGDKYLGNFLKENGKKKQVNSQSQLNPKSREELMLSG